MNSDDGICIVGTGAYLPEHVMTNADLERQVETSDEWIRTRTGISERHIAAPEEATSDMAAIAARRALEAAGVAAEDVDLIIVATVTPDMPFPSTACFVQHKIGARRAFCFDIEAACSGFLYALEVGTRFLAGGGVKTALIIGAEKLSGVTDWTDRATCVLFGDGAGAAVLQARPARRGIIGSVAGSDGSLAGLLSIPGGGSRNPTSPATIEAGLHFMKMQGNEVFKHAVRCMSDSAQKVLERHGIPAADVRWVIPHQANLRIIQAIANRLDVGLDRFCINLDRVGNMSGASIPVALDEAVRAERIQDGDVLLFVAFGGGFTWGATVMEWSNGK
jgi:3-oxoacyl-[acyl-carrier-protein] synthase-3